MPIKLLFTITFSILCLLVTPNDSLANAFTSDRVTQQSNTIDLRERDWGNGAIHELLGNWSFVWNTFTHDSQQPPNLDWRSVRVPGPWTQQTNAVQQPQTAILEQGYGTYFLQILVPEDLTRVYIHIPDMASAYELWSQGVRLGGNGSIGTDRASEEPGYLPHVFEFSPIDGVVELYIKTSNFHYRWGGIWYPPVITDNSGVYEIRELPLITAASSVTALLVAAIFCMFLFLSRPQEKKMLYFSLFCFAISVRRLCMEERILYLLSDFDWSTLQATESITMYLMVPFFMAYFQNVFPETTSKKLALFGWICALPFCVVAMVMEVNVFAALNPYFQLCVLAFVPFILYSWYRAFRQKHQYSREFGLSLFVFLIVIVNDILNYNYIIRTTNLTHFGVLAFVLFQLVSLVKRYLSNFSSIESLSITLQEQNKELIKLDEFKDDFLASTSHELRMPLHGIAGLAKTINQESPSLSAGALNHVKLIESTAVRLGNLVNDILDLSSLKHDKLNLQLAPTHLKSIVESTIQSLQPLAKNKSIDLKFDINDDADQVLVDDQRLHQILYNLIGNAIKFTEKGSVTVTAHCKGQESVVQVLDTGVGISSAQIEQAFDPSVTVMPSTRNEIRGSGLGLPITRKLVELHSGRFVLKRRDGGGTIAEFTLQKTKLDPSVSQDETSLYEREASGAKSVNYVVNTENLTEESAPENTLTKNALIYYADDEAVNQELVASQLVAAGYLVELFPDGQSLLDQLSTSVPDLILLDWMMPGKNGLEVCREIRDLHDSCTLPIIMLTARHQVHDIVRALNAGANDYLTKPYHEQELSARVFSQISVKRLLIASLENKRLIGEVTQHQLQKRQLDQSNVRLASALDNAQESILLLNEDLDILFANHKAKSQLGITELDQNDAAIARYVDKQSFIQIRNNATSGEMPCTFPVHIEGLSKSIVVTLQASDNEGERVLSLTLQQDDRPNTPDTQSLLASLTQELAQNRQRMEHIESTLIHLNHDKPSIVVEASEDQPNVDRNQLVVNTLRTALSTWQRYTKESKADLAEKSRCWSIYIDGTTAKTRTMDKYLSVKTLPAKPRWRAVVNTASYVIDNCPLNDADDQDLKELVQNLNEAYS